MLRCRCLIGVFQGEAIISVRKIPTPRISRSRDTTALELAPDCPWHHAIQDGRVIDGSGAVFLELHIEMPGRCPAKILNCATRPLRGWPILKKSLPVE